MNRPMLIILGVFVLSGVALGFLLNSFDPFATSVGIKIIFLVSVFILVVSLSLLVLYGIAVAAHNGLKYYIARYFGPEASYFKSSFRRSLLIGVLTLALIGLRRFGFFTPYFAGGASAIILILEMFYSTHDKKLTTDN